MQMTIPIRCITLPHPIVDTRTSVHDKECLKHDNKATTVHQSVEEDEPHIHTGWLDGHQTHARKAPQLGSDQ
jgi:hypothetical protein